MFKWISEIFRSKSNLKPMSNKSGNKDVFCKVPSMKLPERDKFIPSHKAEVKKRLPQGPDKCYDEPGKCYRCGNPSEAGCEEVLDFYDNVRAGIIYPQVEYDAKTLLLPRCKYCSEHEVSPGWGYFIYLQIKGVNGWKNGKGPTQQEIDAAWNAFRHPVKNIWAEALANQKKEKAQQRLNETHIFDQPIARIDQYEILKELGTGGFGSVFLARDSISQVLVAIKVIPSEINKHEEEKENLKKNFGLFLQMRHAG